MRCVECNRCIEDSSFDPDYKLCNCHYNEYLTYLEEILPENFKKTVLKRLRNSSKNNNDENNGDL